MSIIESAINISASALSAQRARMEVIAQNIANAETIRTDTGEPYQKRVVSLQSVGEGHSFEDYLSAGQAQPGVRISSIDTDTSPFKRVYDPENPYADADGYVTMSNVDTTEEMLDLLAATRAYEANITAINATKSLLTKTLEIGK